MNLSMTNVVRLAALMAVLGGAVAGVEAQPAPPRGQAPGGRAPLAQLSGDQTDPPPPVAPEVISRGANGRMVIRATRLTQPLRIDGRLDEEFYSVTRAVSDFIQTLPAEGQPATERTEAWIAFDDNFIYISGKCYDSAPPEEWTANEMRRDTGQLRQNDMFGVFLDTYHDRRNGFNFYTNPLGGFADQWITNEGNPNADWNPVWQVRTGRFDGGWTAEMAIPFKSIRYKSGKNQEWGIQLRRSIRRKNEWTHLTFLPAATGGSTSIFRVSRAATLIGLDLPEASRNIDLKPYGISRLTTDKLTAVSNELEPNVGVDMKVGITANLTADLTYNTDFSQVEVDEQQLNLTRFSIQFPEKRDFFLEGRGIFDFGRGGPTVGLAAAGGASTALTPTLFYSRAIGLNNGRVIPIIGGARVTGKVGRYNVGFVNMQTNEDDISRSPQTNFTVMRVSRDILRRSSIGMMLTNRSQSALVTGAANMAFGADAAFSLFQNLNVAGYFAQSNTDTRLTDNTSYQGRMDYIGDRYGLRVEQLHVGNNFNPEVGFTRRRNFDRTFAQARFSPRPRRPSAVSASSPTSPASSTSRTASATWKPATRTCASPWSGRTVTSSRLSTTTTTSCCCSRSRWPRGSASRAAGTASGTSPCRTSSASSAASTGTCRSTRGPSTTATSPASRWAARGTRSSSSGPWSRASRSRT